jgi:hypothetical protein
MDEPWPASVPVGQKDLMERNYEDLVAA